MSSNVDDLVAEYGVAKSQGRGTDMSRVKKALAALGVDAHGKPLAGPPVEAAPAASARAAAAAGDADAPTAAPRGRTTAQGRQHKA